MELQRIKGLVKEVVVMPQLSDDIVILVSANPYLIDIAVGADAVIDYIGLEGDEHVFRVWETLALRVKNAKSIVRLVSKK